jgi:hypothetical protein
MFAPTLTEVLSQQRALTLHTAVKGGNHKALDAQTFHWKRAYGRRLRLYQRLHLLAGAGGPVFMGIPFEATLDAHARSIGARAGLASGEDGVRLR